MEEHGGVGFNIDSILFADFVLLPFLAEVCVKTKEQKTTCSSAVINFRGCGITAIVFFFFYSPRRVVSYSEVLTRLYLE